MTLFAIASPSPLVSADRAVVCLSVCFLFRADLLLDVEHDEMEGESRNDACNNWVKRVAGCFYRCGLVADQIFKRTLPLR